MKPPKNFYSNLDRRKQGLPEVPEASAADAGKIIKVGEDGAYELGADENTIVIPNPETTPSATLNTLTIGNTTYKVNDARVTKILGLRFTINNGGTYNANLPVVSLVDIYGNAAVLPVYTMTCDKNVQYGGLTLAGTPGVLNENLPAAFTVIFNAEFNVEDYPNIKFSKTGLFPADSAKNLKIEYTLDSENWVEIADLVSIDWSEDYHVYDMSTGEEVETIPEIPTPTAADAGKVLGVDNNGEWVLNRNSYLYMHNDSGNYMENYLDASDKANAGVPIVLYRSGGPSVAAIYAPLTDNTSSTMTFSKLLTYSEGSNSYLEVMLYMVNKSDGKITSKDLFFKSL